MIHVILRSLALLGFSLTVTACTQHDQARANCFNFRDAPAQTAPATERVSTKRPAPAGHDTACSFLMLGASG
ncbi:MAG: hypothetical protein H3C33_16150 [Rhodocyclaceae bacterium]|nr:hypothetical protein [Rhodocyclaceae bacterium]